MEYIFKVRARARTNKKLCVLYINIIGVLASFIFFLYFCSLK